MAHTVVTAIDFGGVLVPVCGSVSNTGPSANYLENAPVSFGSLGLTNEQAFNYGTDIGHSWSKRDPSANEFVYNVPGGETNLHDDAVLKVGPPHYLDGYHPKHQVMPYLHGERIGNTLELWFGISVPSSSPAGYDTEREWVLVACGVTFTNGDYNPAYEIVCVEHFVMYNNDGTVYRENYFIVGGIRVNPAAYKINENIDAYFGEGEPAPPEEPFDPSQPDPYRPYQDDTSDLISIPTSPTIGVTSAGFINIYNPSAGALQGLGDILFPNITTATDIVDAVFKLCETIMNQNLINYVIDCHIIPVQPTAGTSANIKVGFRDTGISVPKVTSDYVDISCGALNLPEYFGGFADYITGCKIYLPFIGFVETLPEFWQAGQISIDYKFNVIDGSFMAYVRSASSKSQLNGSVIAQYGGNACMHLPITGVNYANMVSGIIGGVVGMATGGTAAAVLGSAASAANTAIRGGSIAQSNGYNSTSALLGVRYPFLLIERPVPNYPSNYRHDKGYPSNISTYLSYVTGFTTISDIDLSGIPFTSNELSELRILLTEGVYF